MLMKALAAAAAMTVCAEAGAQLYKCVNEAGKVTYSDAGCPSSARYADIKAPPVVAPTARDAEEAQRRRAADNRQVALIERQRRIEAARPAPAAAGLSAGQVRGVPAAPARAVPSAKCEGIRHQLRRGEFMDPLGFDRTIHAHELRRAERDACGP